MKAALATGTPAAKASSFVVYPEAGHAFHADYRPSYRKEAAEDRDSRPWMVDRLLSKLANAAGKADKA